MFVFSALFALACISGCGTPDEPLDSAPGPSAAAVSGNTAAVDRGAVARAAPRIARSRSKVGTVATVFDGISAENTRESKRYTLPAGPYGQVRAVVDQFYYEGGQLSMVGRALDSDDSKLILKADERGAYGWVAYPDKNVAFEYTTDPSGNLAVEQVPVDEVLPVCQFHHLDGDEGDETPPTDAQLARSAMMPPHVGAYDGGDVTKLQSLPGASKVWYIDLTDVMNGQTPIGQTPKDVYQTWQSLAAVLSAFDINVTTDRDVYKAAGITSSGIAKMADVDEGSSSCGLNTFGSAYACDIHRYQDGYATGRILAHEVGHGLGMRHDGGDDGGEYFNGFSDFQWTPLMGNVWPGTRWKNALYQWSKGEYATATAKEDDFANIDRHLDYREDDIATSVPLLVQGSTLPIGANFGQIGRNTDSDGFTFAIGPSGGQANVKIDRIEFIGGAMLDVDASIVSASGMVMAQHNAPVARHAQLDVTLPAGEYTLLVKGGAEGNMTEGFTTYSSVGFYGIEGTITGAADSGSAGMGGAGGTGGGGGNGGASGSGLGGVSTGGGGVASGYGGTAGASSGGTAAGAGAAGSSGAGMSGAVGNSAGAAPGASGGASGPLQNAPTEEGGCSCRVNSRSTHGSGLMLGAAALLALLRLRRRPMALRQAPTSLRHRLNP
jgi:hypothetical protein